MDDLIPIDQNDDGTVTVSMRALHVGVESGKDFTSWAQRMFSYGFDEGSDFVEVLPRSGENPSGGRPRRDWALTLDAAKEIAMLQRSERGQQVRRYFIAAEKRLREVAAPAIPRTFAEALRAAADAEDARVAAELRIEAQRPAIEYHERFVAERDDIITVDRFAPQYGASDPTVRDLLLARRVAVRKLIGERWSKSKRELEPVYEWRARQGVPTAEWFELRPQHNVPRLHNGQVRQTLYVRQFYAQALAEKLGLTSPDLFAA